MIRTLPNSMAAAIAGEAARIARLLRSWEDRYRGAVEAVPLASRESALNLAHFVLYRAESARLERMLEGLGLRPSREPLSVLPLTEFLESLPKSGARRALDAAVRSRKRAKARLDRRTAALLGKRVGHRRTRLIVNVGGEAAHTAAMSDLLLAGLSAVRINCARGDRDEWRAIIRALGRAERKTGRRCRIFMDLAGPKVRIASVVRAGSRETEPRVRNGDRFFLISDARSARGIPADAAARVTLSIPGVLSALRPGHPLLIDDGKIVARVVRVGSAWAEAEVTGVRENGRRLRAERSVNLPGTSFHAPALTAKDEQDLLFAAVHADLVGLSFVREADHIAGAAGRLREAGGGRCGLVVKVENADAFRNLPLLLFEALKLPRAGLLIARGDLASECGFDSLPLIQRESAALARAAHLPVILATQVMEQMVQEGIPSRAEVGDVAGAEGIDALLLNRGKFLAETLRFVDSVVE